MELPSRFTSIGSRALLTEQDFVSLGQQNISSMQRRRLPKLSQLPIPVAIPMGRNCIESHPEQPVEKQANQGDRFCLAPDGQEVLAEAEVTPVDVPETHNHSSTESGASNNGGSCHYHAGVECVNIYHLERSLC